MRRKTVEISIAGHVSLFPFNKDKQLPLNCPTFKSLSALIHEMASRR